MSTSSSWRSRNNAAKRLWNRLRSFRRDCRVVFSHIIEEELTDKQSLYNKRTMKPNIVCVRIIDASRSRLKITRQPLLKRLSLSFLLFSQVICSRLPAAPSLCWRRQLVNCNCSRSRLRETPDGCWRENIGAASVSLAVSSWTLVGDELTAGMLTCGRFNLPQFLNWRHVRGVVMWLKKGSRVRKHPHTTFSWKITWILSTSLFGGCLFLVYFIFIYLFLNYLFYSFFRERTLQLYFF